MKRILLLISLVILGQSSVYAASSSDAPILKAKVDLHDKASLQRGAKLYIDNCAGCHSMDYLRFNRMAKDIGIANYFGEIDRARLEKDFIFTGVSVNDHIASALTQKDAEAWFGIKVPDLSLVARVRGADWLYTYLASFYRDAERPFGSNNRLFPDVAMPNVLEYLQGTVVPRYRIETINYEGEIREVQKIADLQLIEAGQMDAYQFDAALHDLVNFLVYAGEPIQVERKRLGFWVLAFLFFFIILTYVLKKEYWRDIKK